MAYLQRAARLQATVYGDLHPLLATTLAALAKALVAAGRPHEAIGCLERALGIRRKVYKTHHYVAVRNRGNGVCLWSTVGILVLFDS